MATRFHVAPSRVLREGMPPQDPGNLPIDVPTAEYARRFFEHNGQILDLYPGGNPSTFESQQIAELPTTFIDSTFRLPSGSVFYASVGDASSVLDAMNAAISAGGNAVVVMPDGDYPYAGAFPVPNNNTGNWIYVVSESVYNGTFGKQAGQRVKLADWTKMARFKCTIELNSSVFSVNNGSKWRFVGIGFHKDRELTGFHVGFVNTALETSDIVFDRCIIRGYKFTSSGVVRGNGSRGFTLRGQNQVLIDSATYELGALGGNGSDRGSVSVYSGRGPYKIVNNYLESGGINMLVGGAEGPYIEDSFEIRINHLYKDPTTDPDAGIEPEEMSDGSRFAQKNLFEVKRGTRFLIEGNIFENSWTDSQNGPGILLKMTTENSNGQNESGHITIRYNKVLRCSAPFTFNALEYKSTGSNPYYPGKPLHHVHVHDNLFETKGFNPINEQGRQLSAGINTQEFDAEGGLYTGFGPYVIHNNGWFVSARTNQRTQQQMLFGNRDLNVVGQGESVVKDNIFFQANYGVSTNPSLPAGRTSEELAGLNGWRVEGNVVWNTTWMRGAEWIKGGNPGQADPALYFTSLNDYGMPNYANREYGPPVEGSRLALLNDSHGRKGPDYDLVEAYTAYTRLGIWPN